MADISLEEFEQRIIAACGASPIVESISVYDTRSNAIRLRVTLKNQTFLDAFYNEWRGRVAFAWIANNERIFGADNAGGWHWHPVDDVARHVSSDHEITFEEFFREVGKRVE
ncbi:MAG: hypothetical protein DPW21_07405 [Anaerolineae bacterium]|jgi:hypothetical protein|nr:hypothetical protein [Chloroflexi bacterium CFX1]MCQ3946510.1 hypothetical protein [Anaerolineae bacterium]MCZ7549985.1 hypothetical protein [Anaerolineales bacterium]OQY86298.1 MAG: hypothetical protein B6D40_01730 [Anaerolineae bacterium UTCFX3]RIK26697.1 MAG: hypothetical protein DCC54_05965 [Anaerolineae bacterium]